MAYRIKLKIQPSANKNLKIYVYRSKNQLDVESINKIKNQLPVIVIDEAQYSSLKENDYYVVYDVTQNNTGRGIIYNGPEPVAIPTNEYEAVTEFKSINQYTYYNTITLKPLSLTYLGVMYYYSIIGVDETNKLITHISRVKAELLSSDYINMGNREIQYCDDYTGLPTDTWETLTTVDWNTEIILGDLDNNLTYSRFGSPFVESVKIFNSSDVIIDTRCAVNFNHITITIPNIWQMNNQEYNYRKLKSFRIRNIYDNKYGDYSEPTYQSLMQVSNEKLVILRKEVSTEDSATKLEPISLNETDNIVYTLIRRNGKYYTNEYMSYGYNNYTLEENINNIGIYSENSAQPNIVLNFNAVGNAVYNYTFYIEDVYGKYSDPTVVLVET